MTKIRYCCGICKVFGMMGKQVYHSLFIRYKVMGNSLSSALTQWLQYL